MKWKEDAGGQSFTAYGSRGVGGAYRISWAATRQPLSPDRATTYYLYYWRGRGDGRLIGHAFSLPEARQRAEEHQARTKAAINAALGG